MIGHLDETREAFLVKKEIFIEKATFADISVLYGVSDGSTAKFTKVGNRS